MNQSRGQVPVLVLVLKYNCISTWVLEYLIGENVKYLIQITW